MLLPVTHRPSAHLPLSQLRQVHQPLVAAPGPPAQKDTRHRSRAFALSRQVFHCVHFECPEQQSSHKEDSSEESGPGEPGPGPQLDPHALQAPSGSSLPSSPGSASRSPNRQHQ